MEKKKWRGSNPKNCNLCGNVLKDIFIDGITKDGPWAIMCNPCYLAQGSRLPYAKYDLNTFEKITENTITLLGVEISKKNKPYIYKLAETNLGKLETAARDMLKKYRWGEEYADNVIAILEEQSKEVIWKEKEEIKGV